MSDTPPLPGMPEPEKVCYVSSFAMGGYGEAEGIPEDLCLLGIVVPLDEVHGWCLGEGERGINSPEGRQRLAALLLLGKMQDKAHRKFS